MWQDEIVEEVREARRIHAAKFEFDLLLIYRDLKQQERQSQRKTVSFSPKAPLLAGAENVAVTANA